MPVNMVQLKETMDLLGEIENRKTKFSCIQRKARENPEEEFTSLAHYLTEENLTTSFRELKKSAASGIDGKSAYDYGTNLQDNIKDFQDTCKKQRHERLKEQFKLLALKLGGRYRYYGIRGNFISIRRMYQSCLCAWFKSVRLWFQKRSELESQSRTPACRNSSAGRDPELVEGSMGFISSADLTSSIPRCSLGRLNE